MLALFRAGKRKVKAAAPRLGLARSRFCEIYSSYLQACAPHQEFSWTSGVSGADHAPDWPAEVDALLPRRLSSTPQLPTASRPAKCSANATSKSIGLRFAAGPSNTTSPTPNPTTARLLRSGAGSAATAADSGNWTPHSRGQGKIERAHSFWQKRLPACFSSEHTADLDHANPQVQALRLQRNQPEIHRELKMKPQQAGNLALKEKRSVLRPAPKCPWWPFVWSHRTNIKIGPDGRLPIGS